MNLNYLYLYLFGISAFSLVSTDAREAILEGIKARKNQFPYQVSVQIKGHGHVCGGGIIDKQYVLTAAHCILDHVRDVRSKNIQILAGTNNLKKPSKSAVTVQVNKIFFPKTFLISNSFDIAVLQLASNLTLEFRGAIGKLEFSRETQPGEWATIAGFGWQTYNTTGDKVHGGTSGDLRYATAIVIRDDSCKKRYILELNQTDIRMCAFIRKPPYVDLSHPYGVCSRDNGSPLVYNGAIIGILTRYPDGCDERELPGLYMRVSYFSKMISNVLNNRKDKKIESREL